MKKPITKLLTAVVLLGAPSAAFAAPRTLPSGAPACGNTMGKSPRPAACDATEENTIEAERSHQRVVRVARKAQARRERRAAEVVRLTLRRVARPRG